MAGAKRRAVRGRGLTRPNLPTQYVLTGTHRENCRLSADRSGLNSASGETDVSAETGEARG